MLACELASGLVFYSYRLSGTERYVCRARRFYWYRGLQRRRCAVDCFTSGTTNCDARAWSQADEAARQGPSLQRSSTARRP